MFKKIAALSGALILALHPVAWAQQGVGNDANTSKAEGIRVLGRDGTNDRGILTDTQGRLDVLSGYPGMEIINHRSNVTLAAAGNDSSAVPFSTLGYRQMFGLLRIKAASFAAAGYMELAVRGSSAAQYDSTALGWWYAIGAGQRRGKSIQLLSLLDRWKMVPLSDSLTGTPLQAPYTGIYLTNLTGAQVIYDYWILGVR